MANLAGTSSPASSVCTFPQASAEALIVAFPGTGGAGRADRVTRGTEGASGAPGRRMKLEVVGQDRPGIVRDISHALASRGVSIEELVTDCVSGSMFR